MSQTTTTFMTERMNGIKVLEDTDCEKEVLKMGGGAGK